MSSVLEVITDNFCPLALCTHCALRLFDEGLQGLEEMQSRPDGRRRHRIGPLPHGRLFAALDRPIVSTVGTEERFGVHQHVA